jgi:hypothetical protein
MNLVYRLGRLLFPARPAIALVGGMLLGSTALSTPPIGSASVFVTTPLKIKVAGEEIFSLGFDRLSAFDYTIVDAGTGATPEQIAAARQRDQVPDWIRVYHEKRVLLTGYLMPLTIENGRTKKFVLMKDVTTCCYGAVPNMNDYVVVTMKEGVVPVQDVPVQLVGVFHVTEKYEGGYVTSLFEVDGEKFLGAKK